MIVLISVCPVFMSLPASGDLGRGGQLEQAPGCRRVRFGAAFANGMPSFIAAYA